jgi:hypothetical protein
MNLIRRSLARLTGLRAGQVTDRAAVRPGRPGRDGFAGLFIQDTAAVANVAAGHRLGQRGHRVRPAGQGLPAATATTPWSRAVAAASPLPRTVQLCIHCRRSPAGFWVSRRSGQTVRRPWCLACSEGLDRDRCDVVPFGS